jgi:hypothetical protein
VLDNDAWMDSEGQMVEHAGHWEPYNVGHSEAALAERAAEAGGMA